MNRPEASTFARHRSSPYLAVATVLLPALSLGIFLDVSDVGKNPRATVAAMVDGSAWQPYVFRALVPTLVRALLALTPASIEDSLIAMSDRSEMLGAVLREMLVSRGDYVKGLYCIVVMYGALLGYAFAFGALFAAVHGKGRRSELARLWGVCCALPFFGFGYIYDFATLFLSTSLWLSLVCRRWGAFGVIYVVSCVNKETTILVSLAFAATQYGQLSRGLFWSLWGFQILAFAAVRAVLSHTYGGNPGTAFEWHLLDHWQALLRPSELLLPGLAIAAVARFVAAGWAQKPMVFRRSLMAMLPAMVVLFVLFGYPLEWRVFYEVLPLIVLLALPAGGQPRPLVQTA